MEEGKFTSNPRTSYDIEIKLAPATKLNKRNTTVSKKLTMTPCRQIVTSSLFFRLMVDLELSETLIPEAWSIIPTFSLIINFYLTKPANITKKSLKQLSRYFFE